MVDKSEITLKHILIMYFKVLRLLTIWLQQMNCVIKITASVSHVSHKSNLSAEQCSELPQRMYFLCQIWSFSQLNKHWCNEITSSSLGGLCSCGFPCLLHLYLTHSAYCSKESFHASASKMGYVHCGWCTLGNHQVINKINLQSHIHAL